MCVPNAYVGVFRPPGHKYVRTYVCADRPATSMYVRMRVPACVFRTPPRPGCTRLLHVCACYVCLPCLYMSETVKNVKLNVQQREN